MIKSVQNTAPSKSELTLENLNNHNQHPIKSINIHQESPVPSVTFKIPIRLRRIQNKVDQFLKKYNGQHNNNNSSNSISLPFIDNDIQSIKNDNIILNINDIQETTKYTNSKESARYNNAIN